MGTRVLTTKQLRRLKGLVEQPGRVWSDTPSETFTTKGGRLAGWSWDRRTIETLVGNKVIQSPQIEEIENKQSLSPRNRTSAYLFTGKQGQRDSLIVVAQLCPEFTARIVDRWQELESTAQFQHLLPTAIPTVDEIRKATAVLAARDSAVTYLQNKIVELGGPQVEQAPLRAVRNSHGSRPSKLLLGDDVASRALDAIKAIPVRLKNPSTGEMFTGDIGDVLIHCRNNKTQWTEGLSRYGIRVEGEDVWIGTGDTAVCHALAKEFGDRSIGPNAILSIDGARRLDKTVKFAGQVCRVTAVSLNEFVKFF